MALSSRRSRQRKAETSQQLIAFSSRRERFAVPISLVDKVVTVDRVHGGLQPQAPGLVVYLNRQISAIDLGQRLFAADMPQLPKGDTAPVEEQSLKYMLVIQSPTHELVGLLVETQPALVRVPTSAFAPVPATYRQTGHIRCIGAIINLPASPPMFLINVGEILGQLQQDLYPIAAHPAVAQTSDPRALGASYSSPGSPRLLTQASDGSA